MVAEEGDMKGIGVANPVGLALPWLPIAIPMTALAAVVLPAVVLAPFLRLRRASGVERQQLKWPALVVTVTALLGLLGLGSGVVPLLPSPFWEAAMILAVAGMIVGLPVAVGIAILRYRLYDIDRIISRVLAYGLLTAVLGLCYVAGSLVFVSLVGAGGEAPSWLVAAATLAAAAVFRPARRRIQAVVDRRFNRRHYDAAKTIEAFSARLREQLDLDTLSAELLAVVDQTMEPTTVSLWLRPSGKRP
jgi:MFS family permease